MSPAPRDLLQWHAPEARRLASPTGPKSGLDMAGVRMSPACSLTSAMSAACLSARRHLPFDDADGFYFPRQGTHAAGRR